MKSHSLFLPGGFRLRVTGPDPTLMHGLHNSMRVVIERGGQSVQASAGEGTVGAALLQDLQDELARLGLDVEPLADPYER
jgi:hypothetical protein